MNEEIKKNFFLWYHWYSKFSLPGVDKMGAPVPGERLPIGGRKFNAAAALILYPKFLKTTDEVAAIIEASPAVVRNWRSEERFQILAKTLERDFSEYSTGTFLDSEILPHIYRRKTEPFLWNNEVLRILIYNLARFLRSYVASEKEAATIEGEDPLEKGLGVAKGEHLEIGMSNRTYSFALEDPLNLIAAREGLQLLVRSYQGLWAGRECPQNSEFLDEALKSYFCDIGLELDKNLGLLEKTYATNNRDEISRIHKSCQRLGEIAGQKIAFLDHLAKSKVNSREVYSVSKNKRPEGRNKKRNG